VATLIIVMAVIRFPQRFGSARLLGLNGHCLVQRWNPPLTDYQAVAERCPKLEGIRLAVPIVEGQALGFVAVQPRGRAGARHPRR